MSDTRSRYSEPPPMKAGRGVVLGAVIVMPLAIAIGFLFVTQSSSTGALVSARKTISEMDRERKDRLRADAGRQSETLERLFALQRRERELASRLARAVPFPATLAEAARAPSPEDRARMEELLSERQSLRAERSLLVEALGANTPDPEPVEFLAAEATLKLRTSNDAASIAETGQLFANIARQTPDDPEAWRALGLAMLRAGNPAEALGAFTESTRAVADLRGPRSPEAARAMLLEAEAMRLSGADKRDVALVAERALNILEPEWTRQTLDMSSAYESLGNLDRAVAFSSPTLLLAVSRGGDEDIMTADAATVLARQLLSQGQYDRAEVLFRRALAIRERILGAGSPEVADAMVALGRVLGSRGRPADAQQYYQRAIDARIKTDGEVSHPVANIKFELGELKRREGRYSEAQTIHKEALDIREELDGASSAPVAESVEALAGLLASEDRVDDAEALFRRALMIREKINGPDAPQTMPLVEALASMMIRQKRLAEAEPLLRRQLAAEERAKGADDPALVPKLTAVADICLKDGRTTEAEPLLRRALAIIEKIAGPESPDLAPTLNNLGFVKHQEGRVAEAGELWRRALTLRQKALGPDHPDLAYSFNNLGFLSRDLGHREAAELFYRRALELQTRALGEGHPNNPQTIAELFPLYAARLTTPASARNALRLAVYFEKLTRVPDMISREEVQSSFVAIDRTRVEALLALEPPRRDLAARLVLRLAVYAKLLELPSRDPFRTEFLDKRIASLGLQARVEDLERRIGVTRVQVWSDPAYTVASARLAAYVDDLAPGIDWKQELLDVRGWDLSSLEPNGGELRRRVDEELQRLDIKPTPAATPAPSPAQTPRPAATPTPTPAAASILGGTTSPSTTPAAKAPAPAGAGPATPIPTPTPVRTPSPFDDEG